MIKILKPPVGTDHSPVRPSSPSIRYPPPSPTRPKRPSSPTAPPSVGYRPPPAVAAEPLPTPPSPGTPKPVPPPARPRISPVLPPIVDHVDFAALYRQKHVPPSAYSAEQGFAVLNALPVDLPLDVRRQSARGMLAALDPGAPDGVAEDARRKIKALDDSAAELSEKIEKFVKDADEVVESLQVQILEQRRAKESAQNHHKELTRKCAVEAERLGEVVRFFQLK